jgi:hypothetical protein
MAGMLTQQDRELVPFSTAVPHVYTAVTGGSLLPFEGPLVDAVLHEVAQAIADLVTIYGATNFQEPLRPLPWAKIKCGRFEHAGTVMRTSNGIEYRRLYIRRGDAIAAIRVLKKSGARFDNTEEIAAANESAEVGYEVDWPEYSASL